MSAPTPPQIVTAGVTVTVPSPISANVSQGWWAIVNNLTPFILSISTDRGIQTIPPLTADSIVGTGGPASIDITPISPPGGPLTPGTTTAYITTLWGLATEPIPGVYPVSLTAQALSLGAVTALQQAEVSLVGSPWITPATPGPAKTFTIPLGSPPFTDIFLGYTTLIAAPSVLISALGATSGINYLPNGLSMAPGGFTTFPFSSVADPSGIALQVSYLDGSSSTGEFVVIGLVYPTSVRPYFGTHGAQGPTAFANQAVAGVGTATLIGGAGVGTFVRIWAASLDLSNNPSTVAASAQIQISGGAAFLHCSVATTPAGSGSVATISQTWPGGLPVQNGNQPIILNNAGASFADASLAWSVDSV